MTFEIIGGCYDEPYSGHRGHVPSPRVIEADRYEIRSIMDSAGQYSIANVVSFYRGDVEITTLFNFPQEIRLINNDA